jgi:hypothetical protein
MPIQVSSRGIVEFVGEHDTGKTLAMLQAVYPWKKTVFVDDDVKGDATVKQIEELEGKKREEIFGEYIDVRLWRTKLGKTPSPTQLMEKVVEPIIDQITRKKWEVIIWDTWRIVYQSIRGHVDTHQSDYRGVVTFRGSSTIIQGLVSRVARMVEQNYLSRLRDSCELLLVSHHIKDWYDNNVVVGVKPESSATFSEVSTMRIWLRRNSQSKVPIMLFLKRPNLPRKTSKGRPRFINIVPPKVTPLPTDESIWDAIERYEKDPVESRALRPDEQPTTEEMTLISGMLSDDQKLYMMEVLRHLEKEKETTSKLMATVSGRANGITPQTGIQILTMAMSEYDMDSMMVSEILEMELEDVQTLEGTSAEIAWKTLQNFSKSSGVAE